MKIATSKMWFLLLVLILFVSITTPAIAQTGADWLGAVEQSRIFPFPENPGAEFGNAVAFSGDTLVVSSRNESVSVFAGRLFAVGAVYVYELENDVWVQQARLMPKYPQFGERFGASVAIYNDTIVVGALGRDVDGEKDVGAAYVFTKKDGKWVQQDMLEPSDGEESDYFGAAVAISGTRLVVGAEGKDIGDIIDGGAVYTFYRSGNKWYQVDSFTASSPVPFSQFGSVLAMEGARLVVGAPSSGDIGTAYIFYRAGSSWVEETQIDPEDDRSGDRFGSAVAINGGTVVIGAPYADPDVGNGPIVNGGAAYVFTQRGSSWQQSARIVHDDARYYDHFGDSVAVDQKTIVVGSPGTEYFDRQDAGTAHIFKRTKGEWAYQSRVAPSNPDQNSEYGASIALVDDQIVVGKPGPYTQAGTVYVYDIQAGVLPETGFPPDAVLAAPQYMPYKVFHREGLWLDIPRLRVDARIVGVPRTGNQWDVRWLGNDVGYLENTAFPLWKGNTVLSGHVTLPGGNPGPFSELSQLKWGDQIILYAEGYAHKYEVREVFLTTPDDLDIIDRSDDYDWLTLITCGQYDPESKTYKTRLGVVAVRVE